MIRQRLIEGKPVWFVVVESFLVRSDQTGEVRLMTSERRRFMDICERELT